MNNMIDYLKQDRVLYISLGVSVLLLLVMGYSYFDTRSEVKALEKAELELISDINSIGGDADIAQLERESERNDASFEQTGYRAELINIDTASAVEFFGPAFTWTNGAEYDEIRDDFIETLGENNSFTEMYLQENSKVKVTQDEIANYIDVFEMKMELGDIDIVPLAAEGESVSYVGFVTFYPYTGDKLVDTSVMESGHAIIRFVVSGDDSDRIVSGVEAWGGSTVGLDR